MAQMRLDPLGKRAGKQVRPGVPLGMADPGGAQACRQCVAVGTAIRCNRGQKVDPGMFGKGLGHADAFRAGIGVAGDIAPAELIRAGGLGGEHQEIGAILHQHGVILTHPIPFQHCELGMMQRPPLAIAPDMREGGDAGLARGQQLLHGEFGRGMQIHRPRHPVIADHRGGKTVQMGLVAGAEGERGRIHLQEVVRIEPAANGALDAVSRQKRGSAVGMAVGLPPLGIAHGFSGNAANHRIGTLAMRLRATPTVRKESADESHRLQPPQGQCGRNRRTPLRRSQGRELPPRQGHAHHQRRHAPDFRRGEGDRALEDHRPGREGPCR